MAAQLSTELGKPLTAAGVRQLLHRARERFADLLLEEVAQSLAEPSPERLEQELLELGLLEYCRPALQRRA
jgi:RNA polymerase sigma-70 factor (ECF subfamily)